jgi:enamine deaminase RidA (YjgF/YER057c/UK114 family)
MTVSYSNPASVHERADQVFANIVALLKSHGLEAAVFVSQLVNPAWWVEVEAVATRRKGFP